MLFERVDKTVGTAAHAEGDVLARGTGLEWLRELKYKDLLARLGQIDRPWAGRQLALLEAVSREPWEHRELALELGCMASELQAANQQLTKLLRAEFVGYGWPFGYTRPMGRYVYEMHPRVAAAFKSQADGFEPRDPQAA